jgi:hypothetical protein
MMPDERRMFGEMVTDLFAAGRAADVVAELVGSGMADEVWSDDEAIALVLGAQGAAVATSTLLDYLATGSAGTLPGRLVLPPLGATGLTAAPGVDEAGQLVVDGTVLAAEVTDADRFLVGVGTELVTVPAAALAVEPVAGFDPDLRLVRVSGRVDRDTAAVTDGSWPTVAARAARGLAFELIGAADAAIEMAVRHVVERHQFGRPLAAFQVVRHRLASAAIAVAGARELALAVGADVDLDEAVLVVKAAAGRAAVLAVQEAQQVCGGMGFTAEFGLHPLVRRVYLLDSLFGGYEAAEFGLGELALASRRLPSSPVAL